MLRRVTLDTINIIKNKAFLKYAQIYIDREKATLENISSFGVPFAERQRPQDKEGILNELEKMGALVRNNRKSVVTTRISSACEACQTGVGSYTTYVSLKCHRQCYFCFNPNQDDYEFYKDRTKDIHKELQELVDSGVKLRHLAVTGGEPFLFKDEVVRFFELAQKIAPDAYTRIYSTGDLVDEELLIKLKNAGLDEFRFSIKMDDSPQKIKHILGKIALAQKYIPHVMVEMPVIPGTVEEMKKLLVELDKLGIFGINLLEFCFPLGNAKEFTKRGFKLKNPPYEIYYNYWYAGGLAVAGSEEACLELVRFALEKNLQLGVHYCSLENKFTGQVYQQNFNEKLDETYMFSEKDYFFKTAKVFGKDRKRVLTLLEKRRIPYSENDQYDFIQFPVNVIPALRNRDIEVGISSNIVEPAPGESLLREVGLDWTTPDLFEMEDITG